MLVEPKPTLAPEPTEETIRLLPGVELKGSDWTERTEKLLTPDAIELVADLHRDLDPGRRQLLAARRERQRGYDAGDLPTASTSAVSTLASGEWSIAELPPDLRRRRVEITGPIHDAKLVINMLSRNGNGARADCAMLDFEDSMKPSWDNVLAGVDNLVAAARGSLRYRRPATPDRPEKLYQLDPHDMPVVMVRCRGLHLEESHLEVDGRPVSAGLFDLAMSVQHSARELLERGRTPKYYVPKVESALEARWWNELFRSLEAKLLLDPGTLRVTFLIETLPAAFQAEEILFELRERVTALNVGRWDKIFSDIKVLREHSDRVLADRATLTMQRPWMERYALDLIRACHRHGAYAMGGMAAFTPGSTPELRAEQSARVAQDKEWESSLGHDGCWVSHPYFLADAMAAFPHDHQLDVVPDAAASAAELLPESSGPKTLAGLRTNVRVGIAYLEGWRRDVGCVAWDNLMEDLATLEISRAQTWQWLRHRAQLDDGLPVTADLVEQVFEEELLRIANELRSAGVDESVVERFRPAADEAKKIYLEPTFRSFLARGSIDDAQEAALEG